ncbi:MAG: MFS transporter [Pseudomonadota bacterium]
MTAATSIDLRRTIIGGAAGNVLEWYDFAAYAYMAPILANLFFPSDDPFASLIATFGAFAAGYVFRPIGGILFGHIGDKFGRKRMLLISVLMMGLATMAVGLLPVEAQIGWPAAALLFGLRIIQGLSVGGEYGGALTFMAEHAPPHRRGLFTSIVNAGASAGFLVGAGVAAIITELFDQATLEAWAWRVPFLVGGGVALLALLLRRGLTEPPQPADIEPLNGLPIIVTLREHWRDVVKVGGLYLAVNSGFYLIFVYVISYLTDIMHMPVSTATNINVFCVFLLSTVPVLFAMVGDRIGRKPMLITGLLGMILLTYPLFLLIHHSAFWPVFLGQVGFALLFSWIFGANPAAQTEAAPRRVRATVLTLGTNISMAIFGGTMPMVAAYLVHRTHDDFSPAYYLIGLACLSLIAVLFTKEMAGKTLP